MKSALGQLQPVNNYLIVACGRLLPDAYRPFSWRFLNRSILNDSFHQQQSFKLLEKLFCEGLESAKSGPQGAYFRGQTTKRKPRPLAAGVDVTTEKSAGLLVKIAVGYLLLAPINLKVTVKSGKALKSAPVISPRTLRKSPVPPVTARGPSSSTP